MQTYFFLFLNSQQAQLELGAAKPCGAHPEASGGRGAPSLSLGWPRPFTPPPGRAAAAGGIHPRVGGTPRGRGTPAGH